jgi:hypothetical protein
VLGAHLRRQLGRDRRRCLAQPLRLELSQQCAIDRTKQRKATFGIVDARARRDDGCVFVRARASLLVGLCVVFGACVRACVCVRACARVCVRACVRARMRACVRLEVGFSQWDSYYLQAGSAKDLRMVAP